MRPKDDEVRGVGCTVCIQERRLEEICTVCSLKMRLEKWGVRTVCSPERRLEEMCSVKHKDEVGEVRCTVCSQERRLE